jgi:hypothetical protein
MRIRRALSGSPVLGVICLFAVVALVALTRGYATGGTPASVSRQAASASSGSSVDVPGTEGVRFDGLPAGWELLLERPKDGYLSDGGFNLKLHNPNAKFEIGLGYAKFHPPQELEGSSSMLLGQNVFDVASNAAVLKLQNGLMGFYLYGNDQAAFREMLTHVSVLEGDDWLTYARTLGVLQTV